MVLMGKINFLLKILQPRVVRKSQVYVNVKRTMGKFHSDKLSVVIIFK